MAYEGFALTRREFPIQQQIGFEALASGAYRPAHGIRAIPMPMSRMLFQFLEMPGRELQYRLHAERWQDMLERMKLQFVPKINEQLNIDEIVDLCSKAAKKTTNDLTMLAIIYAWLGRGGDALKKCIEVQTTTIPIIGANVDWEQRMKSFCEKLAVAIESGSERDFLIGLSADAGVTNKSDSII